MRAISVQFQESSIHDPMMDEDGKGFRLDVFCGGKISCFPTSILTQGVSYFNFLTLVVKADVPLQNCAG